MNLFSGQSVVLRRRHRDEMCGVDALGDTAEMVKMHSIWNGSSLSFEDQSVGASVPRADEDFGVPTWFSVSLSGEAAEPVMAWGGVSHVSKFPVLEFLHSAELPVDVAGGEESWLSATAEAKGCLCHKNNTTDPVTNMGRKEAR